MFIKQVYHSNNEWLRQVCFYPKKMPFDILRGISAKKRQEIYDLSIIIKNTLYLTDFDCVPDEIWQENPTTARCYEAIRGYSRVNKVQFNMPSTIEAMFIISKVMVREGRLR